MKQLINDNIETIALDNFKHFNQFIGMIDGNGEKHILVPSSIYNRNRVTFRQVNTPKNHYGENASTIEAIQSILEDNPSFKLFIFEDGVEMAKWILE